MPLETLEKAILGAFDLAEQLAAPTTLTSVKAPRSLTSADVYGHDFDLGQGIDTRAVGRARENYVHYRGNAYAAIRVIAQRISTQPVLVARVGRPSDQRRSLKNFLAEGMFRRKDMAPQLKRFTPDEIEMIPDHPLLDVLDDPNELMTQPVLWLVSVANLCISGRCLWVIDPDPNDPEILPIPTSWATPDHDTESGKLFARWKIRPPNSGGEGMDVDGEFVANIYLPDPENPLGCLSMIEVNGEAILTEESISTAQRVAFNNEINPATAIMVGEAVTGEGKRQMKLEPAQRKQLIAWLRQEYAGARKFGLPIICDAIVKEIRQLNTKPKEIGFTESAKETRDKVFMGFGVPLSSAGLMEGSNYGSSGVADHGLCVNAVNPIANLFSHGITAWVLPLFQKAKAKQKERAWIVPAEAYDPDLEIRRWTAGRQSFAASRNEMRLELLGLPQKDGLDDVVVPAGFQSVELGQPIVPVANTPGASGQGSAQNGPPNDAADNENMRTENRDPNAGKGSKEVRASLWKEHVKDVRSMWLKVQGAEEAALDGEMKRYFKGQVDSAMLSLKSHRNLTVTDPGRMADILLPKTDWDKKLRDTLRPVLRKQMQRGAAMQLTSAQRGARATFSKAEETLINLSRPVQDAIQRSIDTTLTNLVDAGMWSTVNDETRQKLSFTIQEGMLEGDTIDELARRIGTEMGSEWSGARALKIARTEAGAALNAGHYAAQKELEAEGLAYGSEWLAIIDDVTRPDHVELNGVRIKAGEMFDVGGTPAPYPGYFELPAEQRVHCRCVSVPVFEPFDEPST